VANYSYLKQLFFCALSLFFIVGLVNYLINPFNFFDVERLHGINNVKPEASKRIRLYKKYQPLYVKPNVLIVGNSRVEMGLNPSYSGFEHLHSVYNLGVPGIGVASQLLYAERVTEKNKISRIFISIDFLDFLTTQNAVPKPQVLTVTPIADKYAALWSLDSFKASLITLFNQNEFSSNRTRDGFNPANDYELIIKFEGQQVLFAQKISMLNAMFKNKVWDQHLALSSEYSDFNVLKTTIERWTKQGINITLFINPYHEVYYDTLERNNLLPRFNVWRRTMHREFSTMVSFCDFTDLGYEKSHAHLNSEELAFFWEPAHYKQELGNIMIDRMLVGCD